MPRRRIERPDEDDEDCGEAQKPIRGKKEKKHILTIQERIKVLNAMLNAGLAFEDLPHKVHVGFKKQLSYLEEQLEEARQPLDFRIRSSKKGKK